MPSLQTSVPHLTTALSGPLLILEEHILNAQTEIEAWFRQAWFDSPAPWHCSVDLRNAGFKIAPIDTNLFPAGFNNLNPEFMPLCIQAAQAALSQLYPNTRRILLIPENHTRNQAYFESLWTLQHILCQAGYEVVLGSLREDITAATAVELDDERQLILKPITRQADRLLADDFSPDIIFLNNDLSDGQPEILQNLSQNIAPPLSMGWATRLKSTHFSHYQQVASEFAELIGIDPWLVDPLFRNCGEVDFMKQAGLECLTHNVNVLLNNIRRKYQEYRIDADPFVIIKADAGTYGMGVMTIHNVEELMQMNRKQRTKMSSSKGNQPITRVILQEGVPSHETWPANNAVAEPVVYMLGQYVVGGFYRVHANRTSEQNLNAPGMQFERLAFARCCNTPCQQSPADAEPNRFYAYGVIARLALLAAAREMQTSTEVLNND